MGYFDHRPMGAPAQETAGNSGLQPDGWRKPTAALAQADRFAAIGETLDVPKARAIVAVKKVAPAIGLKAQDLLLLDTFGSITQAQDWQKGQRPIVWPSNHFLMEQTGFSLTTLRRHVRRLCEVGVITMKDSSNGKRWGRRDAEGLIVEAYGFDLSPLAARAEEFEGLYAQMRETRAACASLRNAITVSRRLIRAKIERGLQAGLGRPWGDLQIEFAEMIKTLPTRAASYDRLATFQKRIKAFLDVVEEAFAKAFAGPSPRDPRGFAAQTSQKMEPTSPETGTHIQTTKQPDPVTRNRFETKQAADAMNKNLDGLPIDAPNKKRGTDIDISALMASCPHFAEMAHATEGYMRNWGDVHRAAATLRPMVGISEDAWAQATKALGQEQASASLALILDKLTTGEVRSPGGYLRGLIAKAECGALRLERSVYGRLKELT